jgi:hypothetical protein
MSAEEGHLAASPRPAWPLLVAATSALLLALALAALFAHAIAFAAWLALTALVPFARAPAQRSAGLALCVGTLGWVLFGLLHAGPPWLFVIAFALALARAFALEREGVRRAFSTRWTATVTAPLARADEALSRALRAAPEDRGAALDAAVVALEHAPATAIPSDEHARRAFWINVYNVLAAHASRGRRSTAWDDLFEVYRTRYRVAGHEISVDQIEHGLLRDNRRAPGMPARPLSPRDPRLALGVPLDPRIHFALNCAARSCPPVRVYRGDALDAQLDLATQSFLEAESSADPAGRALSTSRLLRWYAPDFGGEAGVRARVAAAIGRPDLDRPGVALRYNRYDWRVPDDLG